MKTLVQILTVISISVFLIHCNTAATETTVQGSVATATGFLTTADGAPLAGAAVAVSTSTSGSLSLTRNNLKNEYGHYFSLPQLTDSDGQTCDDIDGVVSGNILATDCTDAEGRYTLSDSDIPCGTPVTFSAKKGSFFLSVEMTIACPASGNTASVNSIKMAEDCGVSGASCSFDNPRIAVVTGAYDEIQSVLAKLGLGQVNTLGQLDTEQGYDFDLIDGVGGDANTVMEVDELLSDLNQMNEYDIIFINCGTSFEGLLADPSVLANLQGYVENGGKLYVTDLSYDFIEQAFPNFMDFYGSTTGDATNPEARDAAEQGLAGMTTDATVNDFVMATWLDSVTVNDGEIDDCYSIEEEQINAKTGARNQDGSITIGGFLSGWSIMEDLYSGLSPATTIWIAGDVESSTESLSNVPLTATRDYGEGRVLYSSYHTAHSCPTLGFWPQERILQYLVFEL